VESNNGQPDVRTSKRDKRSHKLLLIGGTIGLIVFATVALVLLEKNNPSPGDKVKQAALPTEEKAPSTVLCPTPVSAVERYFENVKLGAYEEAYKVIYRDSLTGVFLTLDEYRKYVGEEEKTYGRILDYSIGEGYVCNPSRVNVKFAARDREYYKVSLVRERSSGRSIQVMAVNIGGETPDWRLFPAGIAQEASLSSPFDELELLEVNGEDASKWTQDKRIADTFYIFPGCKYEIVVRNEYIRPVKLVVPDENLYDKGYGLSDDFAETVAGLLEGFQKADEQAWSSLDVEPYREYVTGEFFDSLRQELERARSPVRKKYISTEVEWLKFTKGNELLLRVMEKWNENGEEHTRRWSYWYSKTPGGKWLIRDKNDNW